MRAGWRIGIALAPLLLLAAPVRNLLEASMLLHMHVEFPLLFVAGWAAAGAMGHHLPPARHPQAAAAFTACVVAWWMVPAALDYALVDPVFAAAKYLGWYAAGFAMGRSWHALATMLRMFFLANMAWMGVTAGILYAESPTRLCVGYLQGEQLLAGAGLVAWGAAAICLTLIEAAAPPAQEGQEVGLG